MPIIWPISFLVQLYLVCILYLLFSVYLLIFFLLYHCLFLSFHSCPLTTLLLMIVYLVKIRMKIVSMIFNAISLAQERSTKKEKNGIESLTLRLLIIIGYFFFMKWCTARVTLNRRLALLWSKTALFKTVQCCLKVQRSSCLLVCSIIWVRAFKWGTVWWLISRGIKTATTRRFPFYLLKTDFLGSSNLEFWYFWCPLW